MLVEAGGGQHLSVGGLLNPVSSHNKSINTPVWIISVLSYYHPFINAVVNLHILH